MTVTNKCQFYDIDATQCNEKAVKQVHYFGDSELYDYGDDFKPATKSVCVWACQNHLEACN